MTKTKYTEMLTTETKAEIEQWIAKFPDDQKQSAVLQALRIVQEQNDNALTDDLVKAVAEYLEMPAIAAFEVATFYGMYNLAPVGKNVVEVCTNISCMLRGSEKIVDHLEQKLDIKVGETTEDGRFTLRGVECLGACVNAPMMNIGKQYHEKLTTEKVDGIISELNK